MRIKSLIILAASAIALLLAAVWAHKLAGYANHGDIAGREGQGETSSLVDRLPRVDRLSQSGVIYTDWFSRQSCTSGRGIFATGRYPSRNGPGAMSESRDGP
jgi:arylsulfatase A-like enzyme